MADNVLKFNFLVGRNEIPGAAEKNAGALTKLATKTASFGKVAAVALGGVAVAAGGLIATGAVMGVKTAASLEQAQIGFTTLLGSSKKAGDYLTKLKTFAAATPFELPGLIDSSRTLLGVGVSADGAMKILKTFGDTAAAVGIGQDQFQRIMLATSQAIGAGRFMTADLNQITNNGIPIWTILSRAMHKPVPVLRDLASHGKLLASDVLPLLEKQMGKATKDGGYLGAMAAQSQTLAGLWSTLMDTINLGLASVVEPLMPALKDLATKGIAFLGEAFKALPDKIKAAMTFLGGVKDYIEKTVMPGVRNALKAIGDKLPKIDLGKLFGDAKDLGKRVASVLLPAGAAILTAAAQWGGQILTGIQTGLRSGDWKPLGKTLADGLVTTLSTLGAQGKRLVGAFTGWFSSIDWLEVGKTVGGQAFPFAIGFANELIAGLFTAARKHPMDVALFILAFIPLGKLASAFGPLRSAIEHLPLGSWFIWLVDHTAAPVWNAFVRLLKFLGKAFLEGWKLVFPGIEGFMTRVKIEMTTRIGVFALEVWAKTKSAIAGMGRAIGTMTAFVVKDALNLIASMLRPFARAGGWLVGKGRDVISGLLGGLRGFWGRVTGWLGDRRDAVLAYFGKARKWLLNAGGQVIGGFLDGLRAIWKRVTAWVANIAQWIADHKGPISLDRRLLVPAGIAIMTGFLNGLKSGAGAAWSFVTSVGGKSVEALRAGLGYLAGGGAANGVGNLTYNARLGKVMAGQQYGWGSGGEWASLWNLWQRESNWNNLARNPSSGAYGIPQSLPPGKMGAAANPPTSSAAAQIMWGLNYIRQRYGDPMSAWAHETAFGWYDRGGLARGAGIFAKGPAPERILSPRQTAAFERLVPMLGRAGGAGGSVVVNVYAPNYVGPQDELVRVFDDLTRQGRLDRAIRRVARA